MTAKNVYVLFYRSDNGPSYMPDFCEDILGIFASFALAQDVIDNAKPSRFEHFRIEAYPLIKSCPAHTQQRRSTVNLLPLLNDPDLMARLNRRAAVFTEAQNDRRLLDAERREIERQRQIERSKARRAKLAMLDGEDGDLIQ